MKVYTIHVNSKAPDRGTATELAKKIEVVAVQKNLCAELGRSLPGFTHLLLECGDKLIEEIRTANFPDITKIKEPDNTQSAMIEPVDSRPVTPTDWKPF